MRYFFISFMFESIPGNTCLDYYGFPSQKKIIQILRTKLSLPDSVEIILISIFEFKSEQDYLDFIDEN